MENKKRYSIKKILLATLWVSIGAGVIVLLAAAMRREDTQVCHGLKVTIHGVSNNFFVDKQDILKAVNEYMDGTPQGQPIAIFKLQELETALQKNVWVKKAQMFFDNNMVLQVSILEREPVARVFTNTGISFYADTSAAMLPLSDKFSARLPVFTSFPSDKKVLTHADSVLLKDITVLSTAIQQDSFCMAIIEQVDITAQRSFEMIPKVGNTSIVFGSAENTAEKFSKLKIFYKEVMMKTGWDYYSSINVQYAGQVVAKRKAAADNSTDSLRTLEIMKLIAIENELRANDSLQTILQDNEYNSTSVSLIQQSFQRDDNNELTNTNERPNPSLAAGLPVLEKPEAITPASVKKILPAAKKTMAPAKPTAHPSPKKTNVVTLAAAKPATSNATKIITPIKPKPAAAKPAAAKPAVAKPAAAKPKAVMKKKNDY